jgi:hypothetical protein
MKFSFIFDVKHDIKWKVSLVAWGHQEELPKEYVYSSIVVRDSVQISLDNCEFIKRTD